MSTITPNLERAQQAARVLLGVGPDPRDDKFWNEYLHVDAKAFADLLNSLGVPRIGAAAITTTAHGETLFDADEVSHGA